MIERISKQIMSKLSDKGVVDKTQIDVYIYGANAFIYTLVSTAGLLLAGVVFHKLWESLLMLCIYYLNQTIGGGFHASTHMWCFAVMLVGLLICLAILSTPFIPWIVYFLLFISHIALFRIPLVLHQNKNYLESQRTILIRRSRITTGIQIFFVIILVVLRNNGLLTAYSLGVMVSAISRVVGFIMLRRHLY